MWTPLLPTNDDSFVMKTHSFITILIFICHCFTPVFMANIPPTTDISSRLRESQTSGSTDVVLSLESVRESLIRQEDTIVFSLIERAKFPLNGPVYDESLSHVPGFSGSLLKYIVRETEAVQSKVGRYGRLDEHPFFPDDLPLPLFPPKNSSQVLHPAAASININKMIWDMYTNKLLPLFIAEGDDSNYGSTALCDLECLQVKITADHFGNPSNDFDVIINHKTINGFLKALSRRIHYGKFVAEVKSRDAPQDYGPAIRAQDRDALMKLLTFESVEETVKRRVEKKAMVFGQEVCLNDKGCKDKFKVDPSVVSRLYGEWVMPLTKLVQVEYLLRRLD
ncbi:hypothetical protein GIB67_035852 [Kingdonia uniflora]|uniref:Chorismate mutase n=1 Tax=Kingdonia uniflora TaxID=39325 RepID=A0A7J7MJK5_9MAGN|nr:hypothetical protein GIB67_035852 [Kingdonia uniflora]